MKWKYLPLEGDEGMSGPEEHTWVEWASPGVSGLRVGSCGAWWGWVVVPECCRLIKTEVLSSAHISFLLINMYFFLCIWELTFPPLFSQHFSVPCLKVSWLACPESLQFRRDGGNGNRAATEMLPVPHFRTVRTVVDLRILRLAWQALTSLASYLAAKASLVAQK